VFIPDEPQIAPASRQQGVIAIGVAILAADLLRREQAHA
jgi:hypothetical protein